MCTLFDEIAREGEKKGVERGIEQGIEKGIEQGIEKGIEQGIRALIESLQEMEISFTKSQKQLMTKFSLSEADAGMYMNKYWK